MPTSKRRAGRNLLQSDLYENKLSYSQHPEDDRPAARKLSRSQISLRFVQNKLSNSPTAQETITIIDQPEKTSNRLSYFPTAQETITEQSKTN